MTSDELIEWSRALADACLRTTIKPEDVEAACAAYVRMKEGKTTNYERYFGTPEKAAETLANPAKTEESFSRWASDKGALMVSLVPPGNVRTNGRTKAMADCYCEWLQEECE